MNFAHLHLLINHVPVIGAVGGVLLLGWALYRRSAELTKVSLGLFALLAVAAGAVYLTGEPAEEVVEGLPGVTDALIERHEEAALIATVALGLTGLLSLAGLLAFRDEPNGIPRTFSTLALVLAFVATGAMGYTANLGGHIRHSEIRAGAVVSGEPAAELPGAREGGGYEPGESP